MPRSNLSLARGRHAGLLGYGGAGAPPFASQPPRDCRPDRCRKPARTAAPGVAADRFRPRWLEHYSAPETDSIRMSMITMVSFSPSLVCGRAVLKEEVLIDLRPGHMANASPAAMAQCASWSLRPLMTTRWVTKDNSSMVSSLARANAVRLEYGSARRSRKV